MTRLGVLTLMLIGGLAALLGSVILYGQAHSEPNRLRQIGFDVCDGRPCWNGIVPGVTDWKTLQDISGPLGGIEFNNGGNIGVQFDSNGSKISALGLQKQNVVTDISVILPNVLMPDPSNPVMLGDVLNLFSDPCGIGIYTQNMTFIYANIVVNVPVIRNKVDLTTPISSIAILDPNLVPNLVTSDLCNSNAQLTYIVLPWKGLGSTDYYYAQRVKAVEH